MCMLEVHLHQFLPKIYSPNDDLTFEFLFQVAALLKECICPISFPKSTLQMKILRWVPLPTCHFPSTWVLTFPYVDVSNLEVCSNQSQTLQHGPSHICIYCSEWDGWDWSLPIISDGRPQDWHSKWRTLPTQLPRWNEEAQIESLFQVAALLKECICPISFPKLLSKWWSYFWVPLPTCLTLSRRGLRCACWKFICTNSFPKSTLQMMILLLSSSSKLLHCWKSASAPFPSQNLLSKWRSYFWVPLPTCHFPSTWVLTFPYVDVSNLEVCSNQSQTLQHGPSHICIYCSEWDGWDWSLPIISDGRPQDWHSKWRTLPTQLPRWNEEAQIESLFQVAALLKECICPISFPKLLSKWWSYFWVPLPTCLTLSRRGLRCACWKFICTNSFPKSTLQMWWSYFEFPFQLVIFHRSLQHGFSPSISKFAPDMTFPLELGSDMCISLWEVFDVHVGSASVLCQVQFLSFPGIWMYNLLSKWRSYFEFPFQLVIFHQHGFSPSHISMCPIYSKWRSLLT